MRLRRRADISTLIAPSAACFSLPSSRYGYNSCFVERERFAQLVADALKAVGCQHALLADSGMELLRMTIPKGLNHLPDDLLQQAIEAVR